MGRTSSTVKNRYNRKAYDQINMIVYKGQKAYLQEHAANRGESLTSWITRAIVSQLEREGGKLPEPDRSAFGAAEDADEPGN